MRGRGRHFARLGVAAMVLGAGLPQALGSSGVLAGAGGNDWVRYLHDNGGSGFTNETLIAPTNASLLAVRSGWPVHAGTISTQPLVSGGLVYWGSWDGFEHATPVAGGADTWSTNLGTTASPACGSVGVVSTGDLAGVAVPGQAGSVPYLFVGGGGTSAAGGGSAELYALDPATGAVRWRTALGSAPDNVIWSSPAAYTYAGPNGPQTSVYIGASSNCDSPLVQGQLVQLDAASGAIQHVFDTVPSGCTGASVWGSPTVDASDGSVYVATGNPGSCALREPYAVDLLKLSAADLTLLDAWQVPAAEQVGATVQDDSDFGSTPTLFTGTVRPGGTSRNLVGVGNKNGIYYVFDRGNLHGGPLVRQKIAKPDADPFNGGVISPSAWDGSHLYVGGGPTTILGKPFKGSLSAFDPNNLAVPLWTDPLNDGPVLGAVTSSPGIAVVGEGSFTVVVDSRSGVTLFRGRAHALFFGAPTISHGVIYEGDSAGYLYAYSVQGA